jgi:hypothetical protein
MSGILDLSTYNQVNVEIIQWPHAVTMTVSCDMGKITGTALAQAVGQFPLGTAGQIHTFNVVGPEFSLILTGGTPTPTSRFRLGSSFTKRSYTHKNTG